MPPVIIPVAAAAAVGGLGIAAGFVTASAVVTSVATTAIAAGIGYLTNRGQAATAGESFATDAPTGQIAAADGLVINAARSIAIRQPLPARRFVYGKCRVGGAVLFQGVGEADNSMLYILTALSDGEIDSVLKFYLGSEEIPVDGTLAADTGTRFFDRVRFEVGTGSPDQATSALLSAGIPTIATADYRQQGIARGVARLKWGSDSSNHSYVYGEGIEPAYLIQGVKVYDPREAGHDVNDETTWTYSANPALCIAHAMIKHWYSPVSPDDIDWDSVETAADDCDDLDIELAGILQADVPLANQLADMLQTFGGAITFEEGLYSIRADKARSPVWTVTDADILALTEITFEADAAVKFDAIKGVYYDAAGDGTRVTTPVIELGAGARETSVDFAFAASSEGAQIVAFRKLSYDRDGGSISIILSDAATSLVPTDVITVSSAVFPFANGNWQVLQVDIAEVGCIVTARRYVSGAYVDPATYVT